MLIKPENLAVGDFSVAELRRAGRRLIDTGGEYASDEIRAWWDQLGRTAVECAGMVMELVVTWRPHNESDKRFNQAAWRAMEACLPVFTFEEDDGLLSPQAASVLLQQLHTYTGLTASAVTSARSPHPLHEALVEKCDLLLLVARSAPFLAEANADAARALAARPEPFVPRSPVSWCAAGFSRRGSPSLVELPFVPANRDTGDDLFEDWDEVVGGLVTSPPSSPSSGLAGPPPSTPSPRSESRVSPSRAGLAGASRSARHSSLSISARPSTSRVGTRLR